MLDDLIFHTFVNIFYGKESFKLLGDISKILQCYQSIKEGIQYRQLLASMPWMYSLPTPFNRKIDNDMKYLRQTIQNVIKFAFFIFFYCVFLLYCHAHTHTYFLKRELIVFGIFF